MKILLLSRYGRLGASSRLRFFQYLAFLQQADIECTVQPLFNDALLSSKYKTGNYALTKVMRAYSDRIGTIAETALFRSCVDRKRSIALVARLARTLVAARRSVCAGLR